MTSGLLLFNLILAIAIIIAGIVVLKFNPSISLIVASIVLGIMSGFTSLETAEIISTGFGDMMISIGLPVGFGVILGQLMSETGCAEVIADSILKVFKGRAAIFGVAFAGLVLTIPVFFDVAVIILMPIAMAVSKKTEKPLPLVIGFLVMGAAIGQSLIPPTPNPLAAAEIFGFDVGIMLIVGTIVGAITCFLSCIVYNKLFNKKGFWKPEKDENIAFKSIEENIESHNVSNVEKRPNALIAFLPIVVPVACILMGTLGNAMFDENPPELMLFLGNKVVAMLLGAIASYIIGWKYLGREMSDEAASRGLATAGMVLLITGAGGSFGSVIKATDIGNVLVSSLGIDTGNSVAILLFAYCVGMVFRVAQGSGTVAGITSMQIMASMSSMIHIHPVYVAIACLAGGNSFGHVNDSGFWVSTNLAGFKVTGGLKTYTTGIFITSIFELLIVIIAALIYPAI